MIGCKLDKRYDSRVCIAAIMSEFWHSRLIYPDVAQAINFNNFDKEIHWRDYRQLIFSFIERIYYTPIVGREFQQDYINYRNAAINHIISYVWRALPVDHVKYFSSDDELVEFLKNSIWDKIELEKSLAELEAGEVDVNNA